MRIVEGRRLTGSAALANIDARNRPWVDEAMLLHALTQADRLARSRAVAAIGTSVSFETLAWSRGRRLYQDALRGMDRSVQPLLVVKIEDVPVGTPQMRLAEIVATLRPFVRHVLLELSRTDLRPAGFGNIGVAGIVAELPKDATLADSARLAGSLVRTATVQRAFSCIAGVHDGGSLAIARAAGVRFACGRAVDSMALTSMLSSRLLKTAEAVRPRAA